MLCKAQAAHPPVDNVAEAVRSGGNNTNSNAMECQIVECAGFKVRFGSAQTSVICTRGPGWLEVGG